MVHGRSFDGDRYTLLGAWQSGLRHKGLEVDREVLKPQAVLRRAHLEPDELMFDRMLLELLNIEALADDPRVKIDTDVGEGGWPQRMTLHAERTVHLEGRLGSDTIRLISAPNHSGGGQRSTLDVHVYFEVVPDEPASWERLLEEPAGALSDLTTLALTHPATIRRVRLHSIAGTRGGDRVWVDLLLPFYKPRAAGAPEGWLASFHKLFSAEDAPDELIPRWHAIRQKYGGVLPLTFAPSYAPFIYNEHRFTSITQAAEALHDQMHGSRDLATEDHSARVDAVLAAELPDELAAWVEGVLRPANSLPFRRKIERLLAECPPVAERIDASILANEITATRNPLSHGSLRRTGMLTNADRYWASDIIRFTVSWYLLVELGIPPDEATERVGQHLDFQHAMELQLDRQGLAD